ncbi:unnamed protein product [Penicillium pancosmium]
MKQVLFMFEDISKALSATNTKFQMVINCADEWLVNTHDEGIQGYNRRVLFEHKVTCHETSKVNGYHFFHKSNDKEETVYCPKSFDMWAGKTLAEIQSSSFQSLRGKPLQYMKKYAAASTVFHETSHSYNVLNDWQTFGAKLSIKQ